MRDYVYLPCPRQLYDDVVRLSDGRIDLMEMALSQFQELVRRTAEDNAHGLFGDRLEEFLAIYHPDILEDWRNKDEARNQAENGGRSALSPMIWKELEIPGGSEVRMQYGGGYHHAKVANGKIVDSDGEFSPSEWASKIAQGTSRNAWRDLYFRFPGRKEWQSATFLRSQRREIDEVLRGL